MISALALSCVGAGEWSLDRVIGIDDDLGGWTGAGIGAAAGIGGALALLAVFWRPTPKELTA